MRCELYNKGLFRGEITLVSPSYYFFDCSGIKVIPKSLFFLPSDVLLFYPDNYFSPSTALKGSHHSKEELISRNVHFFTKITDKQRIESVLQSVQLRDDRNVQIKKYSKGMLERLSLAVTFISPKQSFKDLLVSQ